MTKDDIGKAIDEAWLTYYSSIEAIALQAFNEHILPVCQAKGWAFHAGLSWGWYIGPKAKLAEWGEAAHRAYAYDPVLTRIREIACSPIPGMPTEDLGSLMPNYEPEK